MGVGIISSFISNELVDIIRNFKSIASPSRFKRFLYEKNAPQARFFMKKNAPQPEVRPIK